MSVDPGSPKTLMPELNGRQALSEYKQPNLRKAAWQLLDTFVPYLALWILMVFMVHGGYSYWILLALTIPASLLLLRIFIFFHDCCHNSFFASPRANRILGYVAGILTFTPSPTGDVPTADITIRPKTWTAGAWAIFGP